MIGQLKKILIVEDEDEIRQALVILLEHEGFKVLPAANGEKGLEVAIAHHPDLIILDILMPKVGGMEMMKKLRQYNTWGRKVPIIILTNLNADEKIMHGIVENEPSYYLLKSDLKITDIIEKVHEVLRKAYYKI
jgi:DNA-binding response OmpR family regulator